MKVLSKLAHLVSNVLFFALYQWSRDRYLFFTTDDDDQSSHHAQKKLSCYNINTTKFYNGCTDICSAHNVSRK